MNARMMPIGRSPKFHHRLWYWTLADENLFDLSPEELYMFKLFVDLV